MTATLATPIPGLHTSCLHCHRTIALPNTPTSILRDNELWGYTHIACSDPYLILMRSLRDGLLFNKGN